MRTRFFAAFGTFALVSIANAQNVVPGFLIALEGNAVPGQPGAVITSLNEPYSDQFGGLGFTGTLTDEFDETFVWSSGMAVWRNSFAIGASLTGGENVMGVATGRKFVYSPSIDGLDGLWTHEGELARRGAPAPGLPGLFLAASSRPTMFGSGTIAWVSSLSATSGGPTLPDRAYFQCTGTTLATCNCLLTPDAIVSTPFGNAPLSTNPMRLTHDESDNGMHRVQIVHVDISTGSANPCVLVNGEGALIVPQEPATGGAFGQIYTDFLIAATNDNGDVFVSAELNNEPALVYNGSVTALAGDFVGPVPMFVNVSQVAIGLSNAGKVAHLWEHDDLGTNRRVLFYGYGVAAKESAVVAATGDLIDTNNDNVGDWVIVAMPNAQNQIIDIVDDNSIAIKVIVREPAGVVQKQAVVRFNVSALEPSFCDGIDFNRDGVFPDTQDVADFIFVFGSGACPTLLCNDIDFNNDGVFPDSADIAAFIAVFGAGSCP